MTPQQCFNVCILQCQKRVSPNEISSNFWPLPPAQLVIRSYSKVQPVGKPILKGCTDIISSRRPKLCGRCSWRSVPNYKEQQSCKAKRHNALCLPSSFLRWLLILTDSLKTEEVVHWECKCYRLQYMHAYATQVNLLSQQKQYITYGPW